MYVLTTNKTQLTHNKVRSLNLFLEVNMHACLYILHWHQAQCERQCVLVPSSDLSIASIASEQTWVLEACIRMFALAFSTYLCVFRNSMDFCVCCPIPSCGLSRTTYSRADGIPPDGSNILLALSSTCTHTISCVSLTHGLGMGGQLVGMKGKKRDRWWKQREITWSNVARSGASGFPCLWYICLCFALYTFQTFHLG